MDFFEQLIYSLVTNNLGLQGKAADALSFFIYDTIKVILLLAIMVFIVSIIRTFVTREKIKKFLGGKKEGIGNLLAAVLEYLRRFALARLCRFLWAF